MVMGESIATGPAASSRRFAIQPIDEQPIVEHPIQFSTPMVEAIVAGKKVATRRILTVPWKGQTRAFPYSPYYDESDGKLFCSDEYGDWHEATKFLRSPYGYPEDPRGIRAHRLWVRETWRPEERSTDGLDGIRFRAGDAFVPIDESPEAADAWVQVNAWRRFHRPASHNPWRPAMYLPRWACRLVLEVTALRVERLQSMTWADIRKEGVGCPEHDFESGFCCSECPALRAEFSKKWDEINGKRFDGDVVWAKNPWVWVVEFKMVERAIESRIATKIVVRSK